MRDDFGSLSEWNPEIKSLIFIFPTKQVIQKSLKFRHWQRKLEGFFEDHFYLAF